MKRTGMPPRTEPMRRFKVVDGDGAPVLMLPKPRTPIKPVSVKRARQNRERAAMADRLYPDRREGTVLCIVPGPSHPADDLHEPLTRARGGSITDEDNTVPMCRQHNDYLSQRPESELGWAYAAGLLKHSWHDDSPSGDAA